MGIYDNSGIVQDIISGFNPDVDSGSTPEDIWDNGGLYPFQAAAVSLELLSDNAADAAAGTGARSVIIFGLDANYAEQNEIVVPNGVAAVALTKQYLRINCVQVLTSGSNFTNVGTLTLRVPGPGATLAKILPNAGSTQMAIYTVPAGKKAYITALNTTITKGSGTDSGRVAIFIRPFGLSWYTGIQVAVNEAGPAGILAPPAWVPIPAKTDIRATAISVNATNLELIAAFQMAIQS